MHGTNSSTHVLCLDLTWTYSCTVAHWFIVPLCEQKPKQKCIQWILIRLAWQNIQGRFHQHSTSVGFISQPHLGGCFRTELPVGGNWLSDTGSVSYFTVTFKACDYLILFTFYIIVWGLIANHINCLGFIGWQAKKCWLQHFSPNITWFAHLKNT